MLKTQYPTDYFKKELVNSEVAEQIEEKEHTEQVAKGLKRPIEDVFSDQELLFTKKNKHKRLKRSDDQQPGPSNQIGSGTISVDHGKNEIDKRLEKFTKAFVKKFEEKLEEYKKEAAVGGTPKAGKTGGKLAEPLGAVPGGAVGLASGIPGAAGGGAGLGSKASSSIWNYLSGKNHRQKAKRVIEVFRQIKKDELRSILVETGGDIFRSFESQFITVTDADESWARAMEKLAVDAMDRAINYIDDYKKKNPSMNIEVSRDLIIQGVISGKSKKGIGASIIHFIKADKLAKVSIIPENIKSRISKPGHTVKNEEEEWKIADLYKGAGVVTVNDNGDCDKYYRKRYEDNAEKYGYRLLFKWEDISNYREHGERPPEEYKYTLKPEELKQKLETILGKINKEEPLTQLTRGDLEGIVEKNSQKISNKKPIWFNTKEPVKSFTGRGSQLESIHNKLQSESGQVVISQTTAITGLGGIGKSELARKYAYDHKEDYGYNVIWINAETEESLKKSFQELAEELKIPSKKLP